VSSMIFAIFFLFSLPLSFSRLLICVLDSLKKSANTPDEIERVYPFIKSIKALHSKQLYQHDGLPDYKIILAKVDQQLDGVNCGVHTVINAINLTRTDCDFDLTTADHFSLFRKNNRFYELARSAAVNSVIIYNLIERLSFIS
jgi:Ulp1 family protease